MNPTRRWRLRVSTNRPVGAPLPTHLFNEEDFSIASKRPGALKLSSRLTGARLPPTVCPSEELPLPNYSLGIDIGGTFTDIVVHDHDTGRQWSAKVLTTHDDPARAVRTGVGALLESGRIDPSRVTRVVHATTLFTNAL